MIRKHLEQLEARENPATVDLSGGVLTFTGDAGADVVTLSVVGSNYVLANNSAFTAIPAGWIGLGGNTATGPIAGVDSIQLLGGDGNDTINVRSTVAPVTIDGEGGADTITLNSAAPSTTGVLSIIDGDVTVMGDTSDTLLISDSGATSGNSGVSISASGITGLLGPSDSRTIFTPGGLFRTAVITSNTTTLAESVTVSGSSGSLTLSTMGGPDAVYVEATNAATTINTGAGNDAVHLGVGGSLDLLLGAISIDTGNGANTLNVDDSSGAGHAVTVTGTQIQGFAPVNIVYKSLGGTLTANLYCGAASTITYSSVPLWMHVYLFGDWTVA